MRRVSGACCECARLLRVEYVKANPAKAKAWKAVDQKRNRSSANARSRRWYAAHREQAKAATSRWQRNHPELVASKGAAYRAAKLQQTPAWADSASIEMVYRAAQVCRVSGFDVHVDHVIPLQGDNVAGFHVHTNLQLLVAAKNRAKANHFSEGS